MGLLVLIRIDDTYSESGSPGGKELVRAQERDREIRQIRAWPVNGELAIRAWRRENSSVGINFHLVSISSLKSLLQQPRATSRFDWPCSDAAVMQEWGRAVYRLSSSRRHSQDAEEPTRRHSSADESLGFSRTKAIGRANLMLLNHSGERCPPWQATPRLL